MTDLRMLVLDVDGVLTEGGIWLQDGALVTESRRFGVRDGAAIKIWMRTGGEVAFLSARPGALVSKRAAELGVRHCITGAERKWAALHELLERLHVDAGACVYVGDDMPDVECMGRCGFSAAVGDAAAVVKRAASYIARRKGGCGAVAEVVEYVLRKQGRWQPLAMDRAPAACVRA